MSLFSVHALSKATRIAKKETKGKARFVRGNAMVLPISPHSLDVVFSFNCIQALGKHWGKALLQMDMALKAEKGKRLVVSFFETPVLKRNGLMDELEKLGYRIVKEQLVRERDVLHRKGKPTIMVAAERA